MFQKGQLCFFSSVLESTLEKKHYFYIFVTIFHCRSAGLVTPCPPRFKTCVYTIVVSTSL